MKIETKHLIDTIQLAENIYFDDYGYKIGIHSYAGNRPSSGNEWKTEMEVAGERLISIHYDELNRGTDWSMCRIDGEPFGGTASA